MMRGWIPLAQEEDKPHWSTVCRCMDGRDRMTPLIKRSDIIASMDFQSDESESYLNTLTSEVVYLTSRNDGLRRKSGPL